jgi:hypothetical protein
MRRAFLLTCLNKNDALKKTHLCDTIFAHWEMLLAMLFCSMEEPESLTPKSG